MNLRGSAWHILRQAAGAGGKSSLHSRPGTLNVRPGGQCVNMVFPHIVDLACLALALGVFTGHNAYMAHALKADPLRTIQGVSDIARREWVASVMREKNGILAVQTLRNSTMVASFMASTATLLAMGVLTLTGQAENLGRTWHALNTLGSTDQGMLVFKILMILLDLFIAFLCFTSSIRLYNHVGFMISTCSEAVQEDVKVCFVTAHLNNAARQFHFGMRVFYFMVPLVFWVFGSEFLLLGTAIMTAIVHLLDRTPRVHCTFTPLKRG